MPASPPTSWADENQANLRSHIVAIKNRLRQHVMGDGASSPPRGGDETDTGQPTALARLVEAFGLSPFERDTLLLCAGMELDAELPALCAAAQADAARPYPTFSLALAALDEAHWSACTAAAPLRHW